jgi:hypothetical protein
LMTHFKLPVDKLGIYLSIPNIAIFIGLILADVYRNRWGSIKIIRRGVWLSFISSVILLLIVAINRGTLSPVIIVASLAMFGMGFVTPHYWTTALSPLKNLVAVASATVVCSQQIFAILTSLIIASTANINALPMSVIIFILAVLALIANWVFITKGKTELQLPQTH